MILIQKVKLGMSEFRGKMRKVSRNLDIPNRIVKFLEQNLIDEIFHEVWSMISSAIGVVSSNNDCGL